MKQFRVSDRVNSTRGPGEDSGNPDRPVKLWADASHDHQERFGKDAKGCMVFAATVKSIRANGDLVVDYYDGTVLIGSGVERQENVTARVQMPWQQKVVQEHLVILLRRNVGYGKVLEGL